jgi:hypothetical protein|tara:strand:+ start:174 stop:413 length:240 start_codon:yes stop_codon:yes gene_type:complete
MEGGRQARIQGNLRQSHLGVSIHTQRDILWDIDVLSSHEQAIVQSLELLHANGGMAQRSQDGGHAIQIRRDAAWAGVFM